MINKQYTSILLDQTKDLIWAVDQNFDLVYANQAYLNVMKEVTGENKKLNTSIFEKGLDEDNIEKWKAYYKRALSGDSFEIEEHFYNPKTKEVQYGHIAFSPIRDESHEIQTVACRNTDITSIIRQKDHARQLMDASLDVFCSIDEAGRFVFVSAVSANHWGYTPAELVGKPYRDLIIDEDLKNTDQVAAEIMVGKEFKSFNNRFRKKNGDIAYNLWSARWDDEAKLMYCVARDAKEKIEEEAEKELLSQINLSFINEEELIPAANRLCETLYAYGKFDLIELWCPNMEQTRINLISNHNQDSYELEASETSFQKNEGLPGKVWYKSKQLLWDEKQISKNFIRKKGTAQLEIRTIIGIPLTFNDELVGVLLIGTKRNQDYLKGYQSTYERLESFIGSKINRKRLENSLRNVYNTIPEILCITDLQGRFLKINNAGCKVLGYGREEILFHALDEFTFKEDRYIFKQKITELSQNNTAFTFENRCLSKDGKVLWLSWNCNSVLREGLVYASVKNITTEVLLRELNNQAGKMAKIGSWEVNFEKNTVFWSKNVHELHETDPDSFNPDLETAIDFYREDFKPLVQSSIKKSIATGKGFDFEAVIVTKKLKETWVRAIGNVETVNGKALRIYGSLQDITDRKESELRLQTLSDDLPGVAFQYVLTPNGQDSMRSVSKASFNIWGLSPEDCEKNNEKVWDQIKKGGDFDEVQQAIQQSIASGEKWHYRWRNILPNGEFRWHEGFGTPNHLPDGTIIFNSMIFDITEEKKAVLLYEETADAARLGTWEIDLLSEKVYLSNITREIHELDQKTEISLEEALDFYKESYREVALQAVQNGIEMGEPWELELPIVTAKGNERWVKGMGQVEMIEGKAVRLYGSFQDIHQRKITEIHLQSITNDIPGVVFQHHLYHDGTDRLLTVSKGSQHIWGLSPHQCEADINLVWDQIKKGGDYEQFVKSITHSIQTKTQWHSKWKNVMPDGKVRWHEGFGTPYIQPDGTVIFNSMVFDYTDEKIATDLYEEASQMAKIGNWELNLANQDTTDNMYWSPMLKEILEVNKDYNPSLTGGFEFYEVKSKILIQEAVERLIKSGTPFDMEVLIQTAKGSNKWTRCIGNAEFTDGKCMRIFGSYQDIHDRKIAEIQLKTLTDNIPGVLFQYLLFPDGTDSLRSVSKGSYQIWGYSPEEVEQDINLVWDQTKAGGDYEKVKKEITAAVKTNSKWLSQYKSVLPCGEMQVHLGSGTPNVLGDGTVLFNSFVMDITRETKNEELLYEAIQMARIGSWEVNFHNNKVLWSDITHQLHETDPTSFTPELAKSINFYREDFREMVQSHIKACIEDGKPFDFDAVIITAEHNERWVRAIGRAEMINGECKRIHGSFQDIHVAKSNELRVKEILDSISDAFYAVDAEWRFTYFNREAENLLKKSSQEVLGGNIWEIFSPAKGTMLEDVYRRVATTGQSENFEYHYPGDECWYEIAVYPSSGGVASYFRNIDERKKAAIDLQKAYQEKDEILESIGDAFIAVDDEWTVTYWNQQAESILGKTKEDIIGKNLWEEFPDAIDTDFYRQYHRAMETGEMANFEEYYPTLNMWIEVTIYPSGNGLSIYFKDITFRKEADIQLLEANERFEIIARATNDAIWDYNIEEDTLFWGDGFKTLFGYEIDKITRTLDSWTSHIHPEDRDWVEKSVFEAIKDKDISLWQEEYRYEKADGTFAFVNDKGMIIRNQKGNAVRMLGAMSDFTQLRKQEKELLEFNESLKIHSKELERSNEELEQFAFITSHDLQEPLRMITGFMDQLKRKYADQLDEKGLQYIYYATDGAKRMKQIILDLLLYSRANRPSEQQEVVNLNEVVSEFLQLRRKLIERKRAVVHYNELPVIETYKAPVTQIFNCLLSNALKYTRENVHPIIDICVKEKGEFLEFTVKDNGIGIDPIFYEKIFIIFQRLHNRKDYEGTGIGLSIAKRCVEFLGGEMWLESKVGEGTTFYFTFSKQINQTV